MSTRPVVAALGQPAGGDDGVGLAVLEELRRRGAGSRAEILAIADTTELIELWQQGTPLVILDAVFLGAVEDAGAVLELTPSQLSEQPIGRLSSHTLGLGQALDLAAALAPAGATLRAPHIIAVGIGAVVSPGEALSPAVAAAVPAAADRVLAALDRLGR